jgi:hypothetical protein
VYSAQHPDVVGQVILPLSTELYLQPSALLCTAERSAASLASTRRWKHLQPNVPGGRGSKTDSNFETLTYRIISHTSSSRPVGGPAPARPGFPTLDSCRALLGGHHETYLGKHSWASRPAPKRTPLMGQSLLSQKMEAPILALYLNSLCDCCSQSLLSPLVSGANNITGGLSMILIT